MSLIKILDINVDFIRKSASDDFVSEMSHEIEEKLASLGDMEILPYEKTDIVQLIGSIETYKMKCLKGETQRKTALSRRGLCSQPVQNKASRIRLHDGSDSDRLLFIKVHRANQRSFENLRTVPVARGSDMEMLLPAITPFYKGFLIGLFLGAFAGALLLGLRIAFRDAGSNP